MSNGPDSLQIENGPELTGNGSQAILITLKKCKR